MRQIAGLIARRIVAWAEEGSVFFRRAWDLPAWQGQWQALAFLDTEHLTINEHVWTAGTNTATISGAGLGLDWTGPHLWSTRASVATRVGAVPVLAGATSTVHAWLTIAKGF